MSHIKCTRQAWLFVSLCVLCLFSPLATAQQYDKMLWLRWERNNPKSEKTIDHQSWASFIRTYRTIPKEGLTLIRYQKIDSDAHKSLKKYIKTMSAISISHYHREEQLAYWLNLYNALVMNIVLEHYPISSIQDINISPGLFTAGPWEANVITIENSKLSLHDIKNRIIRPIWNDPRTLYALSNGSLGAPNLFSEPFKRKDLNKQLNQVASYYINCMRGVHVIGDKLIASELYQWYEEDFGDNKQDVIEHIKIFASPLLKRQLDKIKTIDTYTYNWHLNAAIAK